MVEDCWSPQNKMQNRTSWSRWKIFCCHPQMLGTGTFICSMTVGEKRVMTSRRPLTPDCNNTWQIVLSPILLPHFSAHQDKIQHSSQHHLSGHCCLYLTIMYSFKIPNCQTLQWHWRIKHQYINIHVPTTVIHNITLAYSNSNIHERLVCALMVTCTNHSTQGMQKHRQSAQINAASPLCRWHSTS